MAQSEESEQPLSVEDACRELEQYVGAPRCMDCHWKLRTAITDNCSCRGNLTPEQTAKHQAAFKRARFLQAFITSQTGKPWDDTVTLRTESPINPEWETATHRIWFPWKPEDTER